MLLTFIKTSLTFFHHEQKKGWVGFFFFFTPIRSQHNAIKVAERSLPHGGAKECYVWHIYSPFWQKILGKERMRFFIFSVRGTGADLPHIHVTQSNSICKSKSASFLCILYQSAVICTLSQWDFGYLLIKASYMATAKKGNFYFHN